MPKKKHVVTESGWTIYYPKGDALCHKIYPSRRALIDACDAFWGPRDSWQSFREAGTVRAVRATIMASVT